MIAVLQRVTDASVVIDGKTVAQIGRGMAVLLAVQRDDTQADIAWMAGKLTQIRMFANGGKNFDLDIRQIDGEILLVSNFTVAADARNGRRPSLIGAADPAKATAMFEELLSAVRAVHGRVQAGVFGADMSVRLANDGPVTFVIGTDER